jgi:hypothetical protein
MKAIFEGTRFSNLFLITIQDGREKIQRNMNLEEIDGLILDLNGIKAHILNNQRLEDLNKNLST